MKFGINTIITFPIPFIFILCYFLFNFTLTKFSNKKFITERNIFTVINYFNIINIPGQWPNVYGDYLFVKGNFGQVEFGHESSRETFTIYNSSILEHLNPDIVHVPWLGGVPQAQFRGPYAAILKFLYCNIIVE